jgi:hypothetical protein
MELIMKDYTICKEEDQRVYVHFSGRIVIRRERVETYNKNKCTLWVARYKTRQGTYVRTTAYTLKDAGDAVKNMVQRIERREIHSGIEIVETFPKEATR